MNKTSIVDQMEALRKGLDDSEFWRALYQICKGVGEGDLLEIYAYEDDPIVKRALYGRDPKKLGAAVHKKLPLLLKCFADPKGKGRVEARKKMTAWFDYATKQDKHKMLKLFLAGCAKDREFAARKLKYDWDEGLRQDVEDCYERTKDRNLLTLFARYFSPEWVMGHAEEFEEKYGYAYACCLLVNSYPDYVDEQKLRPEELLKVYTALGWKVEEERLRSWIGDTIQNHLEECYTNDSSLDDLSEPEKVEERATELKWRMRFIFGNLCNRDFVTNLSKMGRMDLVAKISEIHSYAVKLYDERDCEEMKVPIELALVTQEILDKVVEVLGEVESRDFHLNGVSVADMKKDLEHEASVREDRLRSLAREKQKVFDEMKVVNPDLAMLEDMFTIAPTEEES